MSALKSFAAGLLAVVGVIGGLDAKSVTSVFPPGWGAAIVVAINVCAALYHLTSGAGKAATSATATKIVSLLLLGACMFLTSCTAVLSGVTGEAIPTVPVQRIGSDGKVDPAAHPFNVATTGVQRAEANPAAVWDLYNAGAVAAAVSDTKKSSPGSPSTPPAVEIPVVDQK